MHELSVAQGIVEACSERADGARVLRVTLEIGTLTCVLPESLRFCYGIVADGTPLANAELEIRRVPGRSRCRDCGADVAMDDPLTSCGCGSVNLERPRGGDQLRIKSMEIKEAV